MMHGGPGGVADDEEVLRGCPEGFRPRLKSSGDTWLTPCILILGLILATHDHTHALGEFIPAGARSAGMGDAYAGLAEGAEGVMWNPGAVTFGKNVSSIAGYDRPFGLQELETVSGAASVRVGRVGIGTTYQGGPVSISEAGITVGIRLKEVGTGLRVRQIRFADRSWTVFDVGVLIVSRNGVRVGLVGLNASGVQTGILGHGGMAGVSVTRGQMTIAVDVQKEAGVPTGGGAGLEYRPIPVAALRAGVGGYPERLTVGLGVHRGPAQIDCGILYHTVLGFSHRVSISLKR